MEGAVAIQASTPEAQRVDGEEEGIEGEGKERVLSRI
jgi:hypothetical protein